MKQKILLAAGLLQLLAIGCTSSQEKTTYQVIFEDQDQIAERAQAAKEINGLIGENVNKVEQGAAQVQSAGDTMHDVVAQIGRVSGLIREIANATGEQSDGLRQVSQAVSLLDEATQQNAALVEEAAAAAASLREQATLLSKAVAVFRHEPALA